MPSGREPVRGPRHLLPVALVLFIVAVVILLLFIR